MFVTQLDCLDPISDSCLCFGLYLGTIQTYSQTARLSLAFGAWYMWSTLCVINFPKWQCGKNEVTLL